MKNYIMAMCVLAIALVPAAGLAAVDTLTSDAPTINNNGTSPRGPATVTVSVSPNVEMSFWSTTTDYAVTSANTVTDITNGLEYATHNTATGYAQRTKTTDSGTGPAPVTGTGVGGLPGDDWTWMGSGAAASGS